MLAFDVVVITGWSAGECALARGRGGRRLWCPASKERMTQDPLVQGMETIFGGVVG
jgi:hypothetical protein